MGKVNLKFRTIQTPDIFSEQHNLQQEYKLKMKSLKSNNFQQASGPNLNSLPESKPPRRQTMSNVSNLKQWRKFTLNAISPLQTVNDFKIDTPVQASEKNHVDMTLHTNHGTSPTVSGALSIHADNIGNNATFPSNLSNGIFNPVDYASGALATPYGSTYTQINVDAPINNTSFIITPFDGLDN
ncbi:8135_t:CDS:2, partial [Gigaspora margarita]